ncbi:5' nucleotidase, NT5C type [Sporosarcina sp. FA9]|uniref:5' nucleotidase, NT5C type n=1 Tax=Sporosarcina sp. FA9 TaxID=3413030 RepID=UPI003F65CD87
MRNLRFGIDIDGTVTCPTSLLPHINKQFGCELILEDIKEYDLTKAFPIDEKTFYEWYKLAESHIYETSPAQPFAQEVLSSWITQFELFYISARGNHVFQGTQEWFTREAIPFDHIELTGSHQKIEAAKKFGVDAFFEDKHDNAVEIHEELQIPVLLFDTPYNRMTIPDGVIRVYDWQEANKWIQHLFPVEELIKK